MRLWLLIVGCVGLPGAAMAQVTDYSAGKSPAQLFSSDCSACHASARGLAKGRDPRSLAGFLREHYTTRQETAAALAAFLASAPAAPEPRTPGESRGRQAATPASRVHQQRAPAAVEGKPEETSVAAPEGGTPAHERRARPGREAAKPPAATPRGKKPDPAAEAAAKAAAEEAEKETLRAKVRDYATTGEEAHPKVAPPAPAAAAAPPAAPEAAPPANAETTAAPAPAESSKSAAPADGSKSSEPARSDAPAPSGEEARPPG